MDEQISVIVPALNERESIGHVVAAMPWAHIAECIVVDNGSTDGTGAVAAAAGARVVTAPRGYGAAMAAGVAASQPGRTTQAGTTVQPGSEVLLFLDGDGADPIEEWQRVAGPVLRGEADLVLASRILGTREPGSMLGSQVFAGHLIGWMVRVLYGFRYTDMCAFRAIRRDTLLRMDMREMTFGWNLEMQIKAVRMGLRIVEVPVDYRCRIGGVSKVSGDWKASLKAAWRIFGVFWRVRQA